MVAGDEAEFIKIAVLDNEIEARLIASILEQRHIPHRLRSFHDTAYDGLFQFQKGWGSLYAERSDKKEVLTVIENVRSRAGDTES